MKKIIAAVLAAALALSLIGCGAQGTSSGEGSAEGGQAKTTMTYGLSAEPSGLDPMKLATMSAFTVTYALYDTLTIADGEGNYVPCLCDAIDVSEDGLDYTITLTKSVQFHDGSTLTVDDIKYSIDRTIEAGWATDMTRWIDNVEVLDQNTVVIHLNTPFGGMLGALASPYFSIMSKAYCESHTDDEIKREPMGTGAYVLDEWVSGDHISLKANENYFAGAPAIKEITLRPITDKNTGLISLETGEVDAFLDVNPTDISLVEENPDLAYYSTDSAGVLSLNMNNEDEILSNELVRKAICAAINKDDIILGALDGMGTAANSPVPTVCAGYSDQVQTISYDPEQAKAWLKEAGYENGLSLSLKVKENNTNQSVAQILKAQLAEVGIDVSIEVMESSAYTTDIYTNGNYQMTIGSWYAMFLDAYSVMYSQFHKDCYGATGNITHVTDETLSGLLDAAAAAGDADKVAAYNAVCDEITAHAYQLPLVYQQTSITTNAALKGVEANPLGVYMLKDFYFE